MSLWHNSSTNELSSTPPWGNSWICDELKQLRYSGWEQVTDDYIPEIVITIQQQIDALNTEYLPHFEALKDAIISASATNDTELLNSLKTEYQTLWSEYNAKMEAIVNG
jgi:hypothetical protein